MDNRGYPPKRGGGRGKSRGNYAGPPGSGRGQQSQAQYGSQNPHQSNPSMQNNPQLSSIQQPYSAYPGQQLHSPQQTMPMPSPQPSYTPQPYGIPTQQYYPPQPRSPFIPYPSDSSSSFFSQQPFTTSSEPLSTVAQQLQNLSFSSQPIVSMPNLGYTSTYKPTPIRQPIQPPMPSYSLPGPSLSNEPDYSGWNLPSPIRQPSLPPPITMQPISPPTMTTGKEIEDDFDPSSNNNTRKPSARRINRKDDNTVKNLAPRPNVPVNTKTGRPLNMVTNHFPFIVTQQTIYQYTVDFKPDLENRYLRQKIISRFVDIIGPYITDGTMLFLKARVGDFEQTIEENNFPFVITVSYTNDIPPGTNAPTQLYNIIFRKVLRDVGLKQIGRHYFDPNRPVLIPQHKVELWPGYITAINPNAKGMMLIADVTHKVLRTDTVLDFIEDIHSNAGRNWQQIAVKQLVGQTILTRYNNRTYRIDDVAWDLNPGSTFKKRNGDELTFVKYYALNYNRTIANMAQPLLVHKHRKKGSRDEEIIYLLPELCTMTGLSETMRSDFGVMKDISNHTRVLPETRGAELEKFVSGIKKNDKVTKELNQWGMQIVPEMLRIQGRVFDAEKVIYANNKSFVVDPKTGEWAHMCRNSTLISSMPLKHWLLVYTSKCYKVVMTFSEKLYHVASSVGFQISNPQYVEIRDESKNSYIEAIRKNYDDKTQCVVCVFPGLNKDRYDAIKQLCSVQLSVPSQCVVQKSLLKEKTLISVCNKIALQINCKLGGELWKLDIPLKRTMIVGIDVCHDTSRGGQSVAGFCATMNDTFTRYCSLVSFQKTGQELVDGLKVCMAEALRQFFKLNNYLPSIVIVFRDGVGDGMLDAVVDHEISQIRATFTSFSENYKPRLSVIVVKKRIHTRLFEKSNDVLKNPPPGTVVDTDCVNKDWYDFYIVSQSVRQGTVSPTHYHVVYDTTELQPEHVQKLTYKLCHLYYNWPGTIRVPAPCQYAHKIAFLVGQSLHTDPSSQLNHLLHYL